MTQSDLIEPLLKVLLERVGHVVDSATIKFILFNHLEFTAEQLNEKTKGGALRWPTHIGFVIQYFRVRGWLERIARDKYRILPTIKGYLESNPNIKKEYGHHCTRSKDTVMNISEKIAVLFDENPEVTTEQILERFKGDYKETTIRQAISKVKNKCKPPMVVDTPSIGSLMMNVIRTARAVKAIDRHGFNEMINFLAEMANE